MIFIYSRILSAMDTLDNKTSKEKRTKIKEKIKTKIKVQKNKKS